MESSTYSVLDQAAESDGSNGRNPAVSCTPTAHFSDERRRRPKSKPICFPAGNDDFRAARNRCAQACRRFNETAEDAPAEVRSCQWLDIVRPGRDRGNDDQLTVTHDLTFQNPRLKAATPFVKPPFFADYGLRLRIGGSTFINRDCKILDTPVADVVIGEGCDIGPNCCIVSVFHPITTEDRAGARSTSLGLPVSIGDNVWIGANVTILGGVTIGNGAVIGAGSLVTKDITSDSVAYGVPARVARPVASRSTQDAGGTVETLQQALRFGRNRVGSKEVEEMENLSKYLPLPGAKGLCSPLARIRHCLFASRLHVLAVLVTLLSLLTAIFLAGIIVGVRGVRLYPAATCGRLISKEAPHLVSCSNDM